MMNLLKRIFKRRDESWKRFRVLNRGSCRVDLGAKVATLDMDWAPKETPQYWIFIRPDSKWDIPKGSKITKEEALEISRFISLEICNKEKVDAVVKLVGYGED